MRHIGSLLRAPFTLIDVGCAGGIGPGWAGFGGALRAFAFDPNLRECARLSRLEARESVEYVPAFVGLPVDHPLRGTLRPARNPHERLSFERTLALRTREGEAAVAELREMRLWKGTDGIADPDKPVVLPHFLAKREVDDVDFVKIDVDGADFEVVRSLDDCWERLGILGLGIEVNYFGTAAGTDNSFHNIDRHMRSLGFELFGLTVRRYSTAALPSPYLSQMPGPTRSGRPFQGDALYLRDLAQRSGPELEERFGNDKLLKLVALFDLFGLSDCATELLLANRPAFSERCDVGDLLDRLTPGREGYANYVAAFERSDPSFFPRRRPIRALRKRIKHTLRRLG